MEQLEVPGAPARLEDRAATGGNALALSEADSLSGLNPAFQGGSSSHSLISKGFARGNNVPRAP